MSFDPDFNAHFEFKSNSGYPIWEFTLEDLERDLEDVECVQIRIIKKSNFKDILLLEFCDYLLNFEVVDAKMKKVKYKMSPGEIKPGQYFGEVAVRWNDGGKAELPSGGYYKIQSTPSLPSKKKGVL